MDIAAEYIFCIGEHCAAVVGENKFRLAALGLKQLLIISHVIHACERMLYIAEDLSVLCLIHYV